MNEKKKTIRKQIKRIKEINPGLKNTDDDIFIIDALNRVIVSLGGKEIEAFKKVSK